MVKSSSVHGIGSTPGQDCMILHEGAAGGSLNLLNVQAYNDVKKTLSPIVFSMQLCGIVTRYTSAGWRYAALFHTFSLFCLFIGFASRSSSSAN